MAMTPEGKVKQGVKTYLKTLMVGGMPVWFFMPVQNGMGVVGIPDFLCSIGGKLLAIETKAPGRLGTVTANQRNQIDQINASGATAIVIDSVEDLIKALVSMRLGV